MWNKVIFAFAALAFAATDDVTFKASNGEEVTVHNTTPPGQPHRSSSIQVGPVNSFPAPIPSLAFYQQMCPDRQLPAEIESDIGPYVIRGDTIWFAATFYDGEGTSGIGAIGSFDIPSRRYEMHYLPEIAAWSGSAVQMAGDDLWIGLIRHPEGPDVGGGLLRYNIMTGAVETYPVVDVITSISGGSHGACAETRSGQYCVRDGELVKTEPSIAK